MFYIHDFQISKNNKILFNTKAANDKFSVIISNNKVKKTVSQYSLVVAAKPLVHFLSLFGSKLVSYEKNGIASIKLISKLYSLFFICTHLLVSLVLIRPLSWRNTQIDVPLNILTKTFGILNIAEAVYSVMSLSIFNNETYVELFNKLDDIDTHFQISKTVFRRRRIISISLAVLPILQILGSFGLRKFYIQNIGADVNFFLILLQGSILYFFIVNIYLKLLMLNALLKNTVMNTMSNHKNIIFQDTIFDIIIKCICIEPKVIRDEIVHSCWFELMQIYDKLADCIHLFNKIYCCQIFAMYIVWLLCTILVICRSLSPSIKYSEVFLSDLFMYSCLNSRPLFLASMCEMFIRERKKTLALLLHVLLLFKQGDQHFSQVKTMIMLVASRQLEISANVFTVNVPTVMNFAGRIISYTVLMIEYFYSHIVSK